VPGFVLGLRRKGRTTRSANAFFRARAASLGELCRSLAVLPTSVPLSATQATTWSIPDRARIPAARRWGVPHQQQTSAQGVFLFAMNLKYWVEAALW
jgi:hypothetical protein